MNKSSNIQNRKIKLLAASRLIYRFDEQCSFDEIYERALRCYEILLDVFESPDTSKEISELIKLPELKIKRHAEAIIERLLFNKENDPYISFGMERYANLDDISRRWKRLMMLYHPDKYSDKVKYEEKAKKINEAYDEIQKKKVIDANYKVINTLREISSYRIYKKYYLKYLKYLPAFILVSVIIMAIISIIMAIASFKKVDSGIFPKMQKQEVSETVLNLNQ